MGFTSSVAGVFLAVASLTASAAIASADDYYVRGELGGSWQNSDTASWTNPGGKYQGMNLDTSGSMAGSIAIGRRLAPNVRADLSYTFLGDFDLASCRVSGGKCEESHNTGSVSSHLFMFNAFVDAPQSFSLGKAAITPFLTAGIGAALHDFNSWNHVGKGAPVGGNDYSGAQRWDFAWSVGAGAAIDVSSAMKRAAFVDVTWRYTDAGTAKGGTTPLTGSGVPAEAYNTDIRAHSVFVGLRIPFGK